MFADPHALFQAELSQLVSASIRECLLRDSKDVLWVNQRRFLWARAANQGRETQYDYEYFLVHGFLLLELSLRTESRLAQVVALSLIGGFIALVEVDHRGLLQSQSPRKQLPGHSARVVSAGEFGDHLLTSWAQYTWGVSQLSRLLRIKCF